MSNQDSKKEIERDSPLQKNPKERVGVHTSLFSYSHLGVQILIPWGP